jgi:hypothetical protein
MWKQTERERERELEKKKINFISSKCNGQTGKSDTTNEWKKWTIQQRV